MKTIFQRMTLAAAMLCPLVTAVPASAANLTLDGSGYYELGYSERYYGEPGKWQSGRRPYLGAGYYRRTELGIEFLTNRSSNRSGSLSMEFWAKPYWDATSGIVLMTLGSDPLYGGQSKKHFHADGRSVLLGARRFPEINLWEYTRNGWKFRDALSFTRKNDL